MPNYHLRNINVTNIPSNIEDVGEKLKTEVFNEGLFGRIASLTVVKSKSWESESESNTLLAYVGFENRFVHKKVVDYFEERPCIFYGHRLNVSIECKIDYVTLNLLKKLPFPEYNETLSRMDYSDCSKRYIYVHNVIFMSNVEQALFDELSKDVCLFGPIESLKVRPYKVGFTTLAILRYSNPERHECVIRYYNQLRPKFCGHSLFFDPSFEEIQESTTIYSSHENSYLDLESSIDHKTELFKSAWDRPLINCHLRSIAIYNLPCVDNLQEQLYQKVLVNAESLFGHIDIIGLCEKKTKTTYSATPITDCYIEFTDSRVHKKVIQHYQKCPPRFYDHTLVFTVSNMVSFHMIMRFQAVSIKKEHHYQQCSNSNSEEQQPDEFGIDENMLDSFECERRDITVHFIPNRIDVKQELLHKLNEYECLFGPIDMLTVWFGERKKKIGKGTVRYSNPKCHKNAIRHFNRAGLTLHGLILFFEPSFKISQTSSCISSARENVSVANEMFAKNTPSDQQDDNSSSSLSSSCIVIENVLNAPNAAQELEEELGKDECLFGPVESVRLVSSNSSSSTSTMHAQVRYVNRNVHEHVVNYYSELAPKFHGLSIDFWLCRRLEQNVLETNSTEMCRNQLERTIVESDEVLETASDTSSSILVLSREEAAAFYYLESEATTRYFSCSTSDSNSLANSHSRLTKVDASTQTY